MNDELTILMLNRISEIQLKMPQDGERIFNRELMNELREKHSPKIQEILTQIEEATIYIAFSKLVKSLCEHFAIFQKAIGERPFLLYLPFTVKSSLLFAGYLWSQIQKMNIVGFVTDFSKIKDGDEILILDDCVYSGVSILSAIDNMSYYTGMISPYPIAGIVHLVVGYSSSGFARTREYQSKRLNKRIIMYCDQFIDPIIFSPEEEELMHQELKTEPWVPMPVYFDHKIASRCSTHNIVYTYRSSNGFMTTYPPFDIKKLIKDEDTVNDYVNTFKRT
jgi:hypothetical protein